MRPSRRTFSCRYPDPRVIILFLKYSLGDLNFSVDFHYRLVIYNVLCQHESLRSINLPSTSTPVLWRKWAAPTSACWPPPESSVPSDWPSLVEANFPPDSELFAKAHPLRVDLGSRLRVETTLLHAVYFRVVIEHDFDAPSRIVWQKFASLGILLQGAVKG